MARGTREIARLIKALGGNEMSAYGLCHLGDYEATLFQNGVTTECTEKALQRETDLQSLPRVL